MATALGERKRVKVYELKNNDWFDRGTGFCTGRVLNDESRLFVESEDQPERLLLETKISKDDGYQKQQETLIVWTEQNGTDMALSFQEAEGCAAIWEFVSHVQQHLQAMNGHDDALSDDAMENFPHAFILPSPELGNLDDVHHLMRSVAASPQGREALSKYILGEDYLSKLVPLVEMAEDFESLEDLHHLCNMMKIIILLNDNEIISRVVSNELVYGVVGALEYDPDFPEYKANHRKYLQDPSRFKEVVPIEDQEVKQKIHMTWRLLYLKDVVLARILDDPTFSVLNSLIFFNQVDIVNHLQSNSGFLTELFGIVGSPDSTPKRRKDAVDFVQTLCSIAKNLQPPARSQLYTNFLNHGLLPVITFALTSQEASMRVAGTDILVAMIDHDSNLVRGSITKQSGKKIPTPLMQTLITLLLTEGDPGVKAQVADAIKILLEPPVQPPPQEAPNRANAEIASKIRVIASGNQQVQTFIEDFYHLPAEKLFQPLFNLQHSTLQPDVSLSEVALHSHLVDILIYLTRAHPIRSKMFILQHRLGERVAQLLKGPHKHLQMVALKFFRSCMTQHDQEWYRDLIMGPNLMQSILDVVYATMPRDNLINSICLDLFEYMKKENLKPLIYHVVETWRKELEQINYVDTFESLITRYEQMKYHDQHPEAVILSQGSDSTEKPITNGDRRWQGLREVDAAEEAYFNTSDDEEDEDGEVWRKAGAHTLTNGSPLVDYPDEDEDVLLSQFPDPGPMEDQQALPKKQMAPKLEPSPIISGTPPEKISEKRRRADEDDEDELSKFSNFKRRNSASSASSTGTSIGSTSQGTLRRKRAFNANQKDSPNGGKKMEISVTLKQSIPADQSDGAR